MLGYLILFVTPFAALALNVLLAWRIWSHGGNSRHARVLFAGPILGLVWTFLVAPVTGSLPFGTTVYVVVAVLLYVAVLNALFKTFSESFFRRHALLTILFTVPAIIAVLAPSAMVYQPDPALLDMR